MENEASPSSKSSIMPIVLTVAIVVIILVGVIAFATNNSSNNQAATNQQPIPTSTTKSNPQPTTSNVAEASYKDGEYMAEGMYISPGGSESIDVTLTLSDGVVTDAHVTSNATRPISKQMQASFIGGYKDQVIGKSLDEINLSKVSASSLAPKGFNDAVKKIKAQAQA